MLPGGCLIHAVLGAVLPALAGHGLALALGFGAVLYGVPASRGLLAAAAVLLLALLLLARLGARARVALCAFLLSTVHGAGMALVPMLGPLCFGDAVPLSGFVGPALAALALHCAATVGLCGLLAGACRLPAYFTSRRVSG